MTVYECLLELDQLGYLRPLMNKGVISLHLIQWMEITKMKLEDPDASYCEISYNVSGTKSTVFRAIASANTRIEELETAAVEDAKLCAMEQNGEDKGKFLFDGHHFELRKAETNDFVGKPQKYTMEEGVTFRQKNAEQQVLKAKSAKLTKDMKAIKDAFPLTHPNIEPDEVTYTVVCVD